MWEVRYYPVTPRLYGSVFPPLELNLILNMVSLTEVLDFSRQHFMQTTLLLILSSIVLCSIYLSREL